jgi:CHASE2 domain-containing sensor protein
MLTLVAGIALWAVPAGERWIVGSYDVLFRFTTRSGTNPPVVIVSMDDKSFAQSGQARGPWDRGRHARFLDRLGADGCSMVVFDVFFDKSRDPVGTEQLVQSIRRFSNVVLAARQESVVRQPDPLRPGIYIRHPVPPLEPFFQAVRETNWGVGNVNTNVGGDCVVRQHWRYPSPGIYDSVSWTAAKLAGARLSEAPTERWVRYYAPGRAWKTLSYVDAEAKPANYFRGKIVFIGSKPADESPLTEEEDEFSTPFTAITGRTAAGVEILATIFLNLVNHDWLRRPPAWIEIAVLSLTGMLLGLGIRWRGRTMACLLAVGSAFAVLFAGACLSHFTPFWFPWLIIAGAQVPVALAFALIWPGRTSSRTKTMVIPTSSGIDLPLPLIGDRIDLPDYELIHPPFGEGAYGKVWLARNAVGQWQALKVIYRAKFGDDNSPYEREFRGIERYKRVSDRHPVLLRIDFVSRMKPQGYFYYAMELGDAVTPGWEKNPADYKPLDLTALCAANHGRLPVRECARIGARLCDALQYLHSQSLAHRDVKPRNIIFVNGEPKLADVGLVTDLGRPANEITWVGTPDYMPPPPEPPGTPAADIYGLGMVLYVISTGHKPKLFPELSATLVDRDGNPDFHLLAAVIFKACHPDVAQRYTTALEMQAALLEIEALPSPVAPPAPGIL